MPRALYTAKPNAICKLQEFSISTDSSIFHLQCINLGILKLMLFIIFAEYIIGFTFSKLYFFKIGWRINIRHIQNRRIQYWNSEKLDDFIIEHRQHWSSSTFNIFKIRDLQLWIFNIGYLQHCTYSKFNINIENLQNGMSSTLNIFKIAFLQNWMT